VLGKGASHPFPPQKGALCPGKNLPCPCHPSGCRQIPFWGVFLGHHCPREEYLGSFYPFPSSATSPPPYMKPSGFYFAIVLPSKFVERADASHPRGTSERRAVSWFAKLEALRSYELDSKNKNS